MSTGFNSPVKRSPYAPYSGNTIAEVAESFHYVNRTKGKRKVDIQEFHRLMKYINGK